MPRFLEDFIIPSLNDGRYRERLKWDKYEKDVFWVRWLHKSTSTWNEEDTIVFQEWDKMKGHYRPQCPTYLTESKQRFRAALYKLSTVVELSTAPSDKQMNYRRYRILDVEKTKKKKGSSKQTKKKPKLKNLDIPSPQSYELQSTSSSESDVSLQDQQSLHSNMEEYYANILNSNFNCDDQCPSGVRREIEDKDITINDVQNNHLIHPEQGLYIPETYNPFSQCCTSQGQLSMHLNVNTLFNELLFDPMESILDHTGGENYPFELNIEAIVKEEMLMMPNC